MIIIQDRQVFASQRNPFTMKLVGAGRNKISSACAFAKGESKKRKKNEFNTIEDLTYRSSSISMEPLDVNFHAKLQVLLYHS